MKLNSYTCIKKYDLQHIIINEKSVMIYRLIYSIFIFISFFLFISLNCFYYILPQLCNSHSKNEIFSLEIYYFIDCMGISISGFFFYFNKLFALGH